MKSIKKRAQIPTARKASSITRAGKTRTAKDETVRAGKKSDGNKRGSKNDEGAGTSLKNSEAIESLEALTGSAEHLAFTAEVLERSELPEKISRELLQRIERITKRCNDQNLYMAVIGEFSSGKSTFINALLRDELLPTHALVTTAAATRLQYGDSLEAKVAFKKTTPRELKVDGNSKKFSVKGLPELNATNLRQFIKAVTSEGGVAPHVSDVTITHPSLFLSEGIVIIDTPGTNATIREHGTITTRVVEQEADAAIVMVPAIIPLSTTLTQFLMGSLRPCLHRCVFVVTRMDQIPLKEQNTLRDNIHRRLETDLGIKLSTLHTCSAQVVMDVLSGEMPVPDGKAAWNERFVELESMLKGRLLRERTLSIAERVLRLLSQLFEELEGHLKKRQGEFQMRSEALEKEIVQDLDSFTKKQHATCQRMFKNQAASVRLKIDDEVIRFKRDTREAARSTIFGVTDTAGLGDALKQNLENVIKSAYEKFLANLENILKEVGGEAEKVGKVFDKEFKEQYRRLAAIGGLDTLRQISPQKNDSTLDTASVLESSMTIDKELATQEENWAGGFGTAGLVIGTLIFPFFGSIFGALFGVWLGSLFAPPLAERQQKIWDALDSKLDSFFSSAETQAKEALEAATKTSLGALDKRIDAYITKYKSVVDAMVAQQNEQSELIKRLQRTTQSDLAEITRRQKALTSQQKRLANR